MLRNFFKIALRNLFKNKLYTFINVGGLAISIGVCTLILLYVQSETSYDAYHPEKDRLYRLALDRIYPDHVSEYAVTPAAMARQAYEDYPEVTSFTRIWKPFNQVSVQYEDQAYLEPGLMAADSNFFQLFGVELIKGDPIKVFEVQNAVVLTESTALKYFGNEDPIGKILNGGFGDLIVTGVSEDVPENTHFHYDLLFNTQSIPFLQNPNYVNFSVYNYLQLQPGTDPEAFESQLEQIVEVYAAGQIERTQGISFADYKAAGNGYHYYLQPVTDIHLTSHLEAEFEPNGNITYIYIFVSISVFVLALAAVNFINLATARSTERAREVGIRKVLGSFKKQLISQFLVESTLISVMGTVLGIGLVYLTMPFFNDLAQKQIAFDLLSNPWFIPSFIAFALFIGLAAGIYPAFVLSSFTPASVLKGKVISGQRGNWIRNGLVVFQFWISIVLICCTLIVNDQMSYLQNKELGFDRENTLVVEQAFALQNNVQTFKDRLLTIPGVQQVGGTSAMPGTGIFFGSSFKLAGLDENVAMNCVAFDENYISTMGMEVSAGRGFSLEFQDSLSLMLNETAVAALNIQGNPIGQRVSNIHAANPQNNREYTIIGILADYNYRSLHTEITPMAIFSDRGVQGFTASIPIKLQSSNLQATVGSINALWDELTPNTAFDFDFLDENLAQLYNTEERSGYLFLVFASIAIVIACVGLFGLAAYIVGNRVKEIGVRKVLGASSASVVMLLLKDFNKLILLAVLVAVPVTILIMRSWLQGFAYYQSIQPMVFVYGGVLALLIAWITVSYQSIKAAVANPVKALRSE